jgi:hypothetical protein
LLHVGGEKSVQMHVIATCTTLNYFRQFDSELLIEGRRSSQVPNIQDQRLLTKSASIFQVKRRQTVLEQISYVKKSNAERVGVFEKQLQCFGEITLHSKVKPAILPGS